MHQCLQIDEILAVIASELEALDEHRPHDDPHSYTVNMALACHTFYEPAMDALWARFARIQPLFRLLPEGKLRREQSGGDSGAGCTLDSVLLPEDWERFRCHARRVRWLQIDDLDHKPTGLDAKRCLETLNALSPAMAFPKLRNLTCFPIRGLPPLSYLGVFLQPGLLRLELPRAIPRNTVRLLDMVGQKVPKLEFLDVNAREFIWQHFKWDSSLISQAGNAISLLQNLIVLTLEVPLEGSILHHLSAFPNLETLRCIVTENSCWSLPPSTPDTAVFPALLDLTILDAISASDVGHISRFLHRLRVPRLPRLAIVAHALLDPEVVRDLMVAISTFTSLEHLHISLEVPPGGHWEPGVYLDAKDVFQPLLRLRCIELFTFGRMPIQYTALILYRLARTWKRLHRLRLQHMNLVNDPYTLPIRVWDLIPFAQRCPDLVEIICIADTRVPSLLDISTDEFLGPLLDEYHPIKSKLSVIDLGAVLFPPESLPHLADFLMIFFPVASVKLGQGNGEAENRAQIEDIEREKMQHVKRWYGA